MASQLSQALTKDIVDRVDKSILWKDEICVSDPYFNDYEDICVTVGFGPGPHYEDTIAVFTTMNDADAPLLAEAFCFFLNHREELLDAVTVSEAVQTKYKAQKEQIIVEMLASQRDLLDKML